MGRGRYSMSRDRYTMGRGSICHEYGGQYTMVRGFDIPWVGVDIS